jgi:CheY-like chemotaxis protein
VDHSQVPGSFKDTVPPGRDEAVRVILVIDDEAMILDMVRDLLELVGYTVLVASTGQAGLAQALAAQPDVIVTDVMMPGMDGHDLCRQLRADARTATIPVIAMSAAYRPQAGDAFDAIIAKPFDIPPFLALIEAQLDGRS